MLRNGTRPMEVQDESHRRACMLVAGIGYDHIAAIELEVRIADTNAWTAATGASGYTSFRTNTPDNPLFLLQLRT